MSVIDIVALRKRYGETETLKGVDLTVSSGELLVLLGPSGCGKSTLLNIVAGLIDPSAGDVRLDGRSVLRVHPKDRDIAMVFQSYALYPNLTVARNIGFALEMRNVPPAARKAAVERVADMLQITPLLGRRPAELSGGQRQRVAIGRAIVREPKVFLFDEPLSNLDAKLRAETRTELKRLHEALHSTIIYVTHDQIEAMTLATRIAVMREGRIEQLGTPEEVYDHPSSTYVAGFLGSPAMNMLAAVVTPDSTGAALCEGAALPLQARLRTQVSPGQKLLAGIRPERIGVMDASPGGGLEAIIETVEFTGSERLVTFRIAGQQLVGRFEPQMHLKPGDHLPLRLAPDDLRWFASDTGLALE